MHRHAADSMALLDPCFLRNALSSLSSVLRSSNGFKPAFTSLNFSFASGETSAHAITLSYGVMGGEYSRR